MMKILKIFILLCSVVSITQAQQLKRWTFCGVGTSAKIALSAKQNIIVASTFGQCPGCTVISDGKTTLRQGFQQPTIDTSKSGGTNPNDCLYKVAFSSTSKTDKCGTYFDFEYEGDNLAGMTFVWDFGPNGVPKNASTINPAKIGFSEVGPQLVKLTVTNKTCSKSQSIIVTPTAKTFVASATVKDILCKGSKNGAVTLAVTGGVPTYTYAWSNGSTTKDLTSTVAGKYTYKVTDGQGCISEADIEVKEPKDSLKIVAKIKDESCKDDKDGEINLTANGGVAPYIFSWNDAATTKDRENLEKGIYVVTVSDANKCVTSAALNVARYCDKKETDFPNTFTPNGDGINDFWEFPGIDEFPKNEVTILNRWGNPVWDKTGMKNGEWNGQNTKGQDLPAGPYYYVVKLNDRDKTVFAGAVTIIR
jgi:gliding motility-associated-like protein